MKKRKAVYAASLDPITNGHVNVIERMAPLYDELIVIVAVDSGKSYTFASAERVAMAKAAVAHLPNVTVDICVGQYVVKKADALGASVVIRGLRNFKDLMDEQTLAEENRHICPHIETLWLGCLPHLMNLSSSMVKGHVGIDPGWEEQVARSVPAIVAAKLKEKYILGKARKHWNELMMFLKKPEKADAVFADLVARYAEPHRAYHTLEHIVNMLDEIECLSGVYLDVLLAIWFHDAIYDPKAKKQDNELQSAALAKKALEELGVQDLNVMSNRVYDIIMATTHVGPAGDYAQQIMIDLDLTVLGKPEKEFDAYQAHIRKEYEWVPEAEFRAGRAEVLQMFMDRPRIYKVDAFRNKYEVTARKNLERALAELKQ